MREPKEWLVLIVEDDTGEIETWFGPYNERDAAKAEDALWDRINAGLFSAELVSVLERAP